MSIEFCFSHKISKLVKPTLLKSSTSCFLASNSPLCLTFSTMSPIGQGTSRTAGIGRIGDP